MEYAIGLIIGMALCFVILKALSKDMVKRLSYDEAIKDKVLLEAKLEQETLVKNRFYEEVQSRSKELANYRDKATRFEAELDAEKNITKSRTIEHKEDVEKMMAQSRLEFENLANKIFSAKDKESKEGITKLLNPVDSNMKELYKEIGSIRELGKGMASDAKSMTKALKGDVKVQGEWGEMILEKILEASGLRKGEEYILQGKGLGLSKEDEDTGRMRRLKPDAIVKLPESKDIIIDSKVSLTHYVSYCSSTDDSEKKLLSDELYSSIKKHVDNLASTAYQEADKIDTLDFVLMFMPTEAAYSFIIQQKQWEVYDYAWNKKVIIVCPTTLFATLRTVASIWRLDKQSKNVEEIAQRGGMLHDKILGFAQDMQRLGAQFNTAQNTYEDAWNKLKGGRGNMLSQAKKLEDLGAKTKKSPPKGLVDEYEDKADDEVIPYRQNEFI